MVTGKIAKAAVIAGTISPHLARSLKVLMYGPKTAGSTIPRSI